MSRPTAAHREVQAPAIEKKLTNKPQEVETEAEDAVVMIFMPISSWEQARELARKCHISEGEILGYALKHLQESLGRKK
jgi:hypothetical protein